MYLDVLVTIYHRILCARAFSLVLQRPHVLYQLAEHPNSGDTFIDRGEEILLARLGLEPASECTAIKVGFYTCEPGLRGGLSVIFAQRPCCVMTKNN